MHNWQQKVAGTVSVAAVAYFVFWACAPTTYFQPSGHIQPREGFVEIGASTALVPGGQVAFDSSSDAQTGVQPSFDFQLSGGAQVNDFLSLRLHVFAGSSTLVGLGPALRFHLLKDERLDIGVDFQGGWLWASVGLPISVEITDRLWFYTQPSFGLRFQPTQLPVGLYWEATDAVALGVTVGLDSEPNGGTELTKNPPSAFRAGVGMSITFD